MSTLTNPKWWAAATVAVDLYMEQDKEWQRRQALQE